MDLGISGKRALITGASMGLGFGVAEALAREGVHLVLFARNFEALNNAKVNLLQKHPGLDVQVISGDMTKPQDIRDLRQYLIDTGSVDIFIVNTARPPNPMRNFLDEDDPVRWEQAYQTQLQCALLLLREITPMMLDRGWGRVVAIGSASVKQPMPKHALSTIFRAGLLAALKHLSNETAGKGLTVNTVSPASIKSDNFAAHYNLDERIKTIPINRLGTVEELASTVAFFCSQQAGFINGANLQVDGGMTSALY